jgi:hypothetical protein
MTPEQKQEIDSILIQFEGLTFNHETRKAMCDRLRDLLIGTAEPKAVEEPEEEPEEGSSRYRVTIEETVTYNVEVVAKNEEQAGEDAVEIFLNSEDRDQKFFTSVDERDVTNVELIGE